VVVLEAPAVSMSAAWGWVQRELAGRTRVCSYDRAGLGWSEAGDGGYDPSRAVDELHTLLDRAAEARPRIMVGHELGAALATAYAARYREGLAALIVIDTPATNATPARPVETRFAAAWPWLARVGVLRATASLARRADGLPDDASGALGAFLNRPDHLTRAAGEVSRWDDTVRLASAAEVDPGLRVLHLAAGGAAQGAPLSDRARARAVATAIATVVETVRTDR
jgi:pimeloyl-ACP methyl ester carboxylesterase